MIAHRASWKGTNPYAVPVYFITIAGPKSASMTKRRFRMYRTAMIFSAGVLAAALSAGAAWANGAVYAMTNELGNNQVLVYARSSYGTLSLTPIQQISTQGGGSGLQLSAVDNLGSAGSVQLDPSNKFLFVVNTESLAANNGQGNYNSDCSPGSITIFSVGSGGILD